MIQRINIVHDAKSLFNHFARYHASGIFFSEKDRAVYMELIFSYTIDIALYDDHLICPEFRLRSSPIGVYRYVDWPLCNFLIMATKTAENVEINNNIFITAAVIFSFILDYCP